MTILKEFREFALRGNVLDLAIGVIIGAAFGFVVNSLVSDVLMPPLGFVTGNIDFSHHRIILKPAPDPTKIDSNTGLPAGEVSIRFGRFINEIIKFLIDSFAIFLLVKGINALYRQEKKDPQLTKTEELLTEIRDALKGGNRPLP